MLYVNTNCAWLIFLFIAQMFVSYNQIEGHFNDICIQELYLRNAFMYKFNSSYLFDNFTTTLNWNASYSVALFKHHKLYINWQIYYGHCI